jgi:hypothetical protein
LNENYWTFGRKDPEKSNSYNFCPSKENITVGWAPKQPNSKLGFECIQIYMKEINDSGLQMTNCSRPVFFACEVCKLYIAIAML